MPETYASRSSTLCEAFQATIQRNPDKIAVRSVGGATTLTFREWGEQVRRLAAGFSALGVRRGDTVALMMANRPEFYPVDVALQHLGATPFSIYNTSAPEQIRYLLTDSEARMVVCDENYTAQINAATAGTSVRHVIRTDGDAGDLPTLADLAATVAPADFEFESTWRAVRPDDVLTLIYTSGTTGDPKGVQLTHANMLAMVDGTEQMAQAGPDERVISFLPSAHVADRWSALYTLSVLGNQVTTVADRKDFAAALVEVGPTVLGAVPQVWQKLKAAVDQRVDEATGVRAVLARWAIGTGQRASNRRLSGRPVSWDLELQARIADALVLSKLRNALGLNDIKLALSGAAPISADVLRFFNGLGIPVCDAWGMSELSGMATMSPPGRVRLGTVGTIVPGSRLRIAADGEVLVSGPIVMKGYLNKPEQTAETIDAEGWVHTGDIGELDADGYLRIVDRKKELIINAGGKNMSPSNIENRIKAHAPLIGQAVAIGDDRKYNVALISLDPDSAAAFAEKHGLAADPAVLAKDSRVRTLVEQAVERANAELSRVEQIKKFTIVADFWEPGSAELTPTMKLRRKPISERYATAIEAMYS
ncbi:AMP-dependent synthetase/ligase [Nocardia sp. CA-136227]|uniref:AMP-dependent synthetase/ligase n=1 Tax=Nocardia sp. CA-136227 TaxID=3239979 RepID=UPI003D955326